MQFLKAYWQLMQPFKRRMGFIIFWILLFESLKQGAPLFFSKLLDFLNSGTVFESQTLLVLLLAVFFSRMLTMILDNIWDRLVARLSADVQKFFRTQSFNRLLRLPTHEHQAKLSGTFASEVEKSCNDLVWEITASSTWEFYPIILGLITSSVMIGLIKIELLLAFWLPLPIFVFFIYQMNSKTFSIKRSRRNLEIEAGGVMAEALANIQTVRVFGTEEFEQTRFTNYHQSIRDKIVADWGTAECNYWSLFNTSMELARLLLLIIVVHFFLNNNLTLGQVVLTTTVSDIAYSAIHRLSYFIRKTMAAQIGILDLRKILESEDALQNHREAQPIAKIQSGISFENVLFCYQDGGEALQGISCQIKVGQIVGLVGKSGSGKTTLVSLLTKLYQPDEGQILIDEKDLRLIEREPYLKLIGFVPQTGSLFSGTLRENIGYGLEKSPSDEELLAAAVASHSWEFIRKMPNRFETRIGERGVRLSGGQAQRIAIARALIRKPQILIFDEATSNLDSESERQIQNWILEQSHNLTDQLLKLSNTETAWQRPKIMIIIAHRLSTVIHADNILVMDQGQVVEQGKHVQLLTQNGLYARLYQQQFAD